MKACGKNMGNDLLVIPCDQPQGHAGECERNGWPVFLTVMDHKYIDQNCHERGCQHLVLQAQRDELLEALQALLDVTPFAETAIDAEIHSNARLAIRKAKGEL